MKTKEAEFFEIERKKSSKNFAKYTKDLKNIK